MAFFNYSTMQMTAKVVYYGPGLCGKTTNLEYIHAHTTEDTRGEMVSLETQTDRTLFFDLLPLEVGTIAGFRSRIQLYTVPGQVFYNTTRKLVLKGVDGVVFVADSQEPMRQANIDSLNNLGENLSALGLSVETIPLVLQYNKRDLDEIASVEALDEQLNHHGWERYEASALHGTGVFETLQGICRLTLLALKKQLETSTGYGTLPGAAAAKAARASAAPAQQAAPEPAAEQPAARAAKESPAPPAAAAPPVPAEDTERRNGRSALDRDLLLRLGRGELDRTRRLMVHLQLRDEQDELLHEIRNLHWEIDRPADRDELQLRLNIALNPKD